MSKIPIEYVETDVEDDWGYARSLYQEELIQALVAKVNELVREVNILRGTPNDEPDDDE